MGGIWVGRGVGRAGSGPREGTRAPRTCHDVPAAGSGRTTVGAGLTSVNVPEDTGGKGAPTANEQREVYSVGDSWRPPQVTRPAARLFGARLRLRRALAIAVG